jgi:four helix bundle protein
MDDASDDHGSSYPLPAIEGSFVAEPTANPVRDKSFIFALDVIKLSRSLVSEHEYVISKQLMRSGTAIGAIVEEAIGAESRRDFLHKMSMAHKEAREAHYWLRLLDASELVRDFDLSGYLVAADELISLLVAITRTVKEKPAG